MSDFAIVSFNGRLGPAKFFEVGTKKTVKASFSVAINKSRRVDNGQGDDGGNWIKTVAWLPCIAWGAVASYLKEQGKSGMPIAGHGEWKTESYEKDGKKLSFSSVSVAVIALSSNYVAKSQQDNKPKGDNSTKKEEDIPF